MVGCRISHFKGSSGHLHHLEGNPVHLDRFRDLPARIDRVPVHGVSVQYFQQLFREGFFGRLDQAETEFFPLYLTIQRAPGQERTDDLLISLFRPRGIDQQNRRVEIPILEFRVGGGKGIETPFFQDGRSLPFKSVDGIFPLGFGRQKEGLAGIFVQLGNEFHNIVPGNPVDWKVGICLRTRILPHYGSPERLRDGLLGDHEPVQGDFLGDTSLHRPPVVGTDAHGETARRQFHHAKGDPFDNVFHLIIRCRRTLG